MICEEMVELVEIKLPPLVAVYHATLTWNTPVSYPAGTFTYVATAYDVAADTDMRLEITAPELDEAAFVTRRHVDPKNASVVMRATVAEPVPVQPVASVLNEGLTTRLLLAMLCASAT
jgi:hypothetical protein